MPRAAALTIEGLAAGQLTPVGAASWLAPLATPHGQTPMQALLPPGSPGTAHHARPATAVRHRQHQRSRPGPGWNREGWARPGPSG